MAILEVCGGRLVCSLIGGDVCVCVCDVFFIYRLSGERYGFLRLGLVDKKDV